MMAAVLTSQASQEQVSPFGASIERLRTDVAALASERNALAGSVRDRIHALLREIDETVLPRSIQVWDDTCCIGEICVARRSVLSAQGRAASLEGGDPQTVAQVLVELAQVGRLVKVIRMTVPPSAGGVPSSVTAQTLERYLFPTTADPELKQLDRLLESHATILLRWSETPQTLDVSGDQRWRKPVLQLAKTFRSQTTGDHSTSTAVSERAQGMALMLNDGMLAIAARDRQGGLCAVLPRDAGLRAIERWQLACAEMRG
jgi:hypothetical protein